MALPLLRRIGGSLISRLRLIEPDDRLVRIKSWRPRWDEHGPLWPTMLVDLRGGQRMTVQPVWDWERVRLLLGYPERPQPPFDTTPM